MINICEVCGDAPVNAGFLCRLPSPERGNQGYCVTKNINWSRGELLVLTMFTQGALATQVVDAIEYRLPSMDVTRCKSIHLDTENVDRIYIKVRDEESPS